MSGRRACTVLNAHFGAENIPERWRATLQLRRELEDFALAMVGSGK